MYVMNQELRAQIVAIKTALGPSHPALLALARATSLRDHSAALALLTKDERLAVGALLKSDGPVGTGSFSIRF